MRLLAARRRHLVHRSARRARDELLRALSEQRQAARLERVAERAGRRLRDGDLDRGRRAETLALRHRRGDEEPQPRDCERRSSRGEQRDRPQHVRGPRLPAGEAARRARRAAPRRGRPLATRDAPAPADCDDPAVGGDLRSRQNAPASIGKPRTSQPAVVGDAAEDVEASRRAGDDHRLVGHEQRVTPRTDAECVGVGEAPAGGVTPQRRTRCRDDHFRASIARSTRPAPDAATLRQPRAHVDPSAARVLPPRPRVRFCASSLGSTRCDEDLDELGGGGLGLVDCLAAGGAVPARLERRPACGVRQGLAVGAAAAAPVGE